MINPRTLKFKTILVASDLTEATSSALRYAQALALTHHATLVLVHVIDPLAYAFPEGAPAFLAANLAAAAELKKIEEETSALGVPVHSVLESGMIGDQIMQAVRDYNADLLVLGTRARTEAGAVALGTVARRLLAHSRCPIMTVTPGAAKTLPWAGCWRRVLAATDFSPASIQALLFAHQVALRQLIVLHVAESQKNDGCSHCRERLRFLAPFNESNTVPVEHIVAAGQAGEVIAEYAQKFAVDLIVLGSPENELTAEGFHTSTVLQIISNAACAVVCFPALYESSVAGVTQEHSTLCSASG